MPDTVVPNVEKFVFMFRLSVSFVSSFATKDKYLKQSAPCEYRSWTGEPGSCVARFIERLYRFKYSISRADLFLSKPSV